MSCEDTASMDSSSSPNKCPKMDTSWTEKKQKAMEAQMEGLTKEMKSHFYDKQLMDFTITTRTTNIRCHRLVLSSSFPFFKGLFQMRMLTNDIDSSSVDLAHLDTDALQQLVEFMYVGELSPTVDNVEQLVEASRYLQADNATTLCEAFLVNTLNSINCLKWFHIGSTYNLPQIQEMAHELVLNYFSRLLTSQDFPKLHLRDLMAFLQDDALNVPTEETVVQAILQWINHDVEGRQVAANRLVDTVRLNYCSEALLSALLTETKYDVITPLRFRNLVRNMLRERFGQSRPSKRRSSVAKSLCERPRFSFTTNKLLVIGGRAAENDAKGCNVRDCMRWDRVQQKWIHFTELPTHFVSCRQWKVCGTDGRIFISGGYHANEETGCWEGCSEVWMWHNGLWTALPPMIRGRWAHGMILASNKLFCFGGKSRKQGSYITHLKHNEVLDLELLNQDIGSSTTSCQWTSTTKMKFNFYKPRLSVLGENIYILGMIGCPSGFIGSTYEYNIKRRSLTQKSVMPSTAQNGESFVAGDHIFVFGIEHREVCMRYTPSTDTWCKLTPTVNITDSAPDSSVYLDYISPLVFVDGKIILAKLRRREKREHTMFVEAYDIDDNSWTKSNITLPACYDNKEVSLFNIEANVKDVL